MLKSTICKLIEYKIRDSLNKILPYVIDDVKIKLTLSVENDDFIVEDHSNNTGCENQSNSLLQDSPIIDLNKRIEQNKKQKAAKEKSFLLYEAESEPLNFIVEGVIGRNFQKRFFNIPKDKIFDIESHSDLSIEDLRGQYCKIVYDNEVYEGHFNTNLSITGYSYSIMVQWSKNSPLDYKLRDVLKTQYDFLQKEKDYRKHAGTDLPRELEATFAFYAIENTKAYKLEINLPKDK